MVSPSVLPFEISASPIWLPMEPVTLPASTLRVKVVVLVAPSRPGTSAVHLPLKSAARAAAVLSARNRVAASSFFIVVCLLVNCSLRTRLYSVLRRTLHPANTADLRQQV